MTPRSKEESFSGWGGYPREACHTFRPENHRESREILQAGSDRSYIARGCGRSYADAALNRGEGVVSQLRLNRMISFDETSGLLECEGGTTLREIAATFLPRGFFLDVTPGTADVTVGGAIAADVHGKNHRLRGSFAATTERLTLLLPDGSTISASRTDAPEVFFATIGGMGLTGMIARASIRLRRIESPAVSVNTKKTRSLGESIDVLEELSAAHEYSICWIDTLARREQGRGIVEGGDHIAAAGVAQRTRNLSIPFNAPGWLLNRRSVSAFNRLRFDRAKNGASRAHLIDFLYPLDTISSWPRLYGSRGFIQYQLVVPVNEAPSALRRVLAAIAASPHHAFLGTLKRFGKENDSLLSFPIEGFTLALDFPMMPGLESLSRALDEMVLEAGGRVYLAKNPWLAPHALDRMYPRAAEFLSVKRRLDPEGRIDSSLARRIGLSA